MEHYYFSRHAKINWLTLDKFAQISSEDLLTGAFAINWADEGPEVLAFRDELEALSDEELDTMFVDRISFREADRTRKREELDAGLFFNAPAAFADYGRWARQLTWSISECIALSLGRSPDVLNAYSVLHADPFAAQSELLREYRARNEIAQNWIKAGQLEEEATPGEYLAWLARARLSCAPELVDAVQSIGHQIADWKTICEELQAEVDDLQSRNSDLAESNLNWAQTFNDYRMSTEAVVANLRDQLEQAKLALALNEDSETLAQVSENEETGLDPRERTSLHKIVFSIAAAKYRFDPNEEQWPAVSKIESDIALSGLQLSRKRIRHHLAAAAETAKKQQKK